MPKILHRCNITGNSYILYTVFKFVAIATLEVIHQQFYLLTIVFSRVSQGNIDRSNRIISHIGDAKTEMLKVLIYSGVFLCIECKIQNHWLPNLYRLSFLYVCLLFLLSPHHSWTAVMRRQGGKSNPH